MLARQGKFEPAIAKYKEAVARPVSLQTYERARSDAYGKLLALLERKQDLNGMEALYKSAVATFGYSTCLGLKYARFLLHQRGNPDGAIEIARKALDVNCRDQDARESWASPITWSGRRARAPARRR